MILTTNYLRKAKKYREKEDITKLKIIRGSGEYGP